MRQDASGEGDAVDQLVVPEDRITTERDRPQRPRPHVRRRPRRRPFRYTLPGLVGALVFLCVSLTPSLLPRTGLTQGLISGITAAFGYGVGVVAAGAWRAIVDRDARPARRRS